MSVSHCIVLLHGSTRSCERSDASIAWDRR
jgi:hypothetical protein